MKLPLYQGESINPARTPQGSAPADNPFASTFERSAAIATNKLLGLEEAEQDRKEFTLEQNREAQAAEATNQLNNQLIHDLSLPEGHPDSPYDEYGILRSEYADNLKANYGSIADSWGKGFVTEQGMQNAYKAAQQWKAGVNATVDSKLRAGSKARVDRAISNNIETCMTYRNYDAADSANLNAFRRGYKTKDQYLQDQNKINCHRAKFDIDSSPNADALNAWLQSPDNAELLYINPDIRKYAENRINTYLRSQATQRKADAEARALEELERLQEEEYALQDAIDEYNANPDVETTKEEVVGTLKYKEPTLGYKDTYRAAPVNASANVRLLFHETGGIFDSPEAKKKAYATLMIEAEQVDQSDPEAVYGLKILANEIGLKDSDATDLLKRYSPENKARLKFKPSEVAADIKALTKAHSTKNAKLMQRFLGSSIDTLSTNIPKLESQQAIVEYALLRTQHEFVDWSLKNPDADSDAQANQFHAIYLEKLKEEKYYDSEFYATNIMPVLQPYIIASEEDKVIKDMDDKQRKEFFEKQKGLKETYDKIIDDYIKQIGVDQALASYPLQAAEMRWVLDAALKRQENTAFKVEANNNQYSAVLPGTKDHCILYIPKSDTPITEHKVLVAKATNGQYQSIRVMQVPGLPSPVASEMLLDRFEWKGRDYNHIIFNDNKLAFTNVETREVNIKDSKRGQELLKLQKENKRKQERLKNTKKKNTKGVVYEPEGELDIEYNDSLFPDDGLVPESHYTDAPLPIK